jgi:hypothetical protein
MSLPMHLRSYREKSKDELARDFFNAPLPEQMPGPNEPPSVVKIRGRRDIEGDRGGMEINAVLSVEGKEEVYVSVPQSCSSARLDQSVLMMVMGTDDGC